VGQGEEAKAVRLAFDWCGLAQTYRRWRWLQRNGELVVAAIEDLANAVVDLIESRVQTLPPPAEQLCTRFRLYLDAA
jgi:hypothetical protein